MNDRVQGAIFVPAILQRDRCLLLVDTYPFVFETKKLGEVSSGS